MRALLCWMYVFVGNVSNAVLVRLTQNFTHKCTKKENAHEYDTGTIFVRQ